MTSLSMLDLDQNLDRAPDRQAGFSSASDDFRKR